MSVEKISHGNFYSVPWEEIRPGVSRSVFATDIDEITCSLGELKNGHEINPHAHPYIQLSICLSGCFDYYVEDTCFKLTKGSWVVVPPNAKHYAHAYETSEMALGLDIFVPGRPAFAETYKEFLAKKGFSLD